MALILSQVYVVFFDIAEKLIAKNGSSLFVGQRILHFQGFQELFHHLRLGMALASPYEDY